MICKNCGRSYKDICTRCIQKSVRKKHYIKYVKDVCFICGRYIDKSYARYLKRGNTCKQCDMKIQKNVDRQLFVERVLNGLETPVDISEHFYIVL